MLFSFLTIITVTNGDEFNSPYYEWIPRRDLRHPVDTEGIMEKYRKTCDEHNFICRAKTKKAHNFPDGLYLAGEVIKGKCIYGWNEIEEEAFDFDVLKPKCTNGQLTWLKEEEELEWGAERIVRVQARGQLSFCQYSF